MSDKAVRARRRAHRLTRKVIRFMIENEDGWEIRLYPITGNVRLCKKLGFSTGNIAGCTIWGPNILIADPRSDVLATIIHECLHAIYPDAPELMIRAMEETCVKHLTRRQAEEVFCNATRLMRVTYDQQG